MSKNQNENEIQSAQQTPTNSQPPRTPLTAIPDPSQSDRKPEPPEPARFPDKVPHSTPRSSRPHAEPNGPRRYSVNSRRASAVYRAGKGGNVSAAESFEVGVPEFELEENPAFWTDHNVQVLIRIRPLSSTERVSQGYGKCLKQESAQSLVWVGHPETRFTFDHVACEAISQEKLFKVAGVPMVENCMYGYNSCMFAYGQTGSGKTYTMMGEIQEMEDNLTDKCGITPRIFEYLFRRIRQEEDKRKDEKLTYSCKCSFLEIYNEQITDLLEPSSTNLQLREDMKKGVYVENLTEYNVRTVNDVANLLLKGAANRKMAATHTNSESSRSHSVFTCIIESRSEKDYMTHFKFARLNLVDLAGSERQKCSGAEGDRLKEAANINRSLSTLGLVIMCLVDLAHGKHRHIPYRDSRLTFLLQDSLGGNSKTMIIANVSPSICSLNETLSTLKFAQRAKLIQNNAKVNEDASGDVTVLQRQIHQLKDQLSFLLKHYELSRSLPSCISSSDYSGLHDLFKDYDYSGDKNKSSDEIQNGQENMINGVESVLIGSLRREKLADQSLQRLQAEIEQMNRMIGQKDEDAQGTKMMLRFREEKIKRLESLLEGLISSENYLVNENKALIEEIQLLKARIDRNPELTRFALENMRLLEQLQQFQSYYKQGEREKVMAEVSELRDQLLDMLEGRHTGSARINSQDVDAQNELADCKKMNSKLIREVDELRAELKKYLKCSKPATDSPTKPLSKDLEEFRQMNKFSMAETISIASEYRDEMTSCTRADEVPERRINSVNATLVAHTKDSRTDLMDANLVIEAMESEQLHLIRELQLLLEENSQYKEILGDADMIKKRAHCVSANSLDAFDENQKRSLLTENIGKIKSDALQAKLDSMTTELEELRLANRHYQEDHASQIFHHHQVEIVREQVELETARTIIHLQEEMAALQSELNERLHHLTQENTRLRKNIENKEDDMKALREEWERATLELTKFLLDSSKYLKDASRHVDSIVGSFPHENDSISKNLERAARACIEKEETILLLQRSLEDAQNMAVDMEVKLRSLKEASIAMNNIEREDEELRLSMLSSNKNNVVQMLEKSHKCRLEQVVEVEKRAYAAFLVIKWIYDTKKVSQPNEYETSNTTIDVHATVLQETETQVKLARAMLLDSLNAVEDTGRHVTSMQTDICKAFSGCVELPQKLVEMIYNLKMIFDDIKGTSKPSPFGSSELHSLEARDLLECGNRLDQVRTELSGINEMLMGVKDYINRRVYRCQLKDEDLFQADAWCADYSTSDSDSSSETFSSAKSDKISDICSSPVIDLNLQGKSILQYDSHDPDPEMKLEKVEACSKYTNETVGDEEDGIVNSFFSRFMKSHATIKEADIMLNELLKANENLTHMNNLWKQAGQKLMAERTTLMKEIAHLKSSLHLKERENQLLQEEIHTSSGGLVAALSSLEGHFLKMQCEVDEGFKFVNSDVVLLGREILNISDKIRSLFEDIFSEFMAKEFTLFVLYQCHMEEVIRTTDSLMVQPDVHIPQKLNCLSTLSNLRNIFINGRYETTTSGQNGLAEIDESKMVNGSKEQKPSILHDNQSSDTLALLKELQRKELLLQGLLFDFKLLQEAASNKKDLKDETEKLSFDLSQARHELDVKSSQLDDLSSQQKILSNCLADTEEFLAKSNSELDQAKEEIFSLKDQNAEFRMLLKDFYLKNSELEAQLEDKKQVVQSLEDELLNLTHALDQKTLMSVQNVEDNLQKVTSERDQLCEEVQSLTDKLEMALAIADENEAIAVEARQESEESKAKAEQKEEEIKVLECSIEELECTINILEKKVYDMEAEVERHCLIRDSSDEELQAWRQRLSTVENLEGKIEQADEISWKQNETLVELHRARNRIIHLEEENTEHKKEIKQYKEYISELLLHAEAQSSQYQCKYKNLEAMFQGVTTDAAHPTATAATLNKFERSSVRTRGSSSPFKCISNLVQQMHTEKDQELSMARIRIEELEALVASGQKEICMLNTRLAAAESMTHDVIRDLLGIKLDMTNYANLIDQQQVQKLVEAAHHYTEELLAKDQDIQLLRKQVDGLIEERKSYMSDVNRREADLLAAQVTVEQLRERDQLLSAQNEMLKMDKTNLKRRVAELDEMVRSLLGTPSTQGRQISAKKGTGSLKLDFDLARRLTHSDKLLSSVNEDNSHYSNPSSSHHHDNIGRSAWK